jgi:hypothetical protein
MAAPNTRACARRGLSFSTLAGGPEASRRQNGQTMLQVTNETGEGSGGLIRAWCYDMRDQDESECFASS